MCILQNLFIGGWVVVWFCVFKGCSGQSQKAVKFSMLEEIGQAFVQFKMKCG
jgi:hypothetical protein